MLLELFQSLMKWITVSPMSLVLSYGSIQGIQSTKMQFSKTCYYTNYNDYNWPLPLFGFNTTRV